MLTNALSYVTTPWVPRAHDRLLIVTAIAIIGLLYEVYRYTGTDSPIRYNNSSWVTGLACWTHSLIITCLLLPCTTSRSHGAVSVADITNGVLKPARQGLHAVLPRTLAIAKSVWLLILDPILTVIVVLYSWILIIIIPLHQCSVTLPWSDYFSKSNVQGWHACAVWKIILIILEVM